MGKDKKKEIDIDLLMSTFYSVNGKPNLKKMTDFIDSHIEKKGEKKSK